MMLKTIFSFQLIFALAIMPNESNQVQTVNSQGHINTDSPEKIEDDMTNMMQRYTAYNLWANQQFAEWLSSASEEDLNLEIESSFSSLRETIFHIWNAEYLWLHTIKDESADNSPAKNFEGSKEELLEGWLKASENFSNHVKTMTLKELQAKRPRSNGEAYTVIADMIQHCMNHSTYHRGQLITMGRQAGLQDPPRTDFIYYVSLFPGD
jgi:uncharacterized damage-inducible protein DinB